MLFVLLLFSIVVSCAAVIHPIEVHGRHFYDSVTGTPFFIKGVDYQPGGSSGVNKRQDPLSNVDKCARDVFLFQQLGLNTIRVYSINPDLNHDECLSLLADAGIYLVLDVNSPLQGQHLNRYEPWSTYNKDYLEHVFQVVTQFSGYNNTLGFFGGNEIVNDARSAMASPVYIKALIRDMKVFMKTAGLRQVPVGYSAADDLKYRISLPQYLECMAESPDDQVDFYGVNTYQWCGAQTFETSGYNMLVKDYANYTKPIFFSEYGCNLVLPRHFQEVTALYSSKLTDVFSGGLVYEFAQEENNYGLVDYDADGNVILLPDYYSLQRRLANLDLPQLASQKSLAELQPDVETDSDAQNKATSRKGSDYKFCKAEYENLDTSKGLPYPAHKVRRADASQEGSRVSLTGSQLTSTYKVYDTDGTLIASNPTVTEVPEPRGDGRRKFTWSNDGTKTLVDLSLLFCLVLGIMV